MNLRVRVKQPGRKHALIDNKIISIENIFANTTAKSLIEAIVQQQVDEYNSRSVEKNILPLLRTEETQQKILDGKVGFDSIYNGNKADVEKAKQTAVQAFEDGMFALFVDDKEIAKIDTVLLIQENSIITFIRLTFLAGSYW